MDLQLTGKRVFVTGSSSGIGATIAKFLAREGCVVGVHGRNAERVAGVVESIRAAGGQAVSVLGEMVDDESVARVAKGAVEALGAVDVLVGNAGGRAQKTNVTWENTTPADFLATYQINVGANVRLAQELAPGMKQRHWGRIILISSVAGAEPKPNSVPDYAASKAALVNVGLSLAKWLRNTGITVNTISPGVIETDGIRGFLAGMAKSKGWPQDWTSLQEKAVNEVFSIPVGRIGQPEEIAAMVALLASDLGGFFHGSNIRIDGGATGVVN